MIFEAVYISEGKISGNAPSYPFTFSKDRVGSPVEGACVRFGWNENGLLVEGEFEDSVLISTCCADEQLHYQTGDVLELFVKPTNDPYYWEMYATPFGNKSTLFFPRERKGMTVEQYLRDHDFRGLEVSAEIMVNGWKASLFVPATQLTALGANWGPGSDWSVFCGRYNYNSETLTDPELSMVPALSTTNYHLTNEYARLHFNL